MSILLTPSLQTIVPVEECRSFHVSVLNFRPEILNTRVLVW